MSVSTSSWALRDLLCSLEIEVALVSSLSRRIDARVAALNAARRQAAERLGRLDELVAAAEEPALREVLRRRTAAPLPVEDELLPDRLLR